MALYSNSKPVAVAPLPVRKSMNTLLVDEMKLGGSVLPQYFPMRGEALESPFFNIKKSQLKKEKKKFAYEIQSYIQRRAYTQPD